VKVTLALSRRSIEFFKREAARAESFVNHSDKKGAAPRRAAFFATLPIQASQLLIHATTAQAQAGIVADSRKFSCGRLRLCWQRESSRTRAHLD
jgi:hypothetical protein